MQSGSQASTAFLFQIIFSLRRIILGIPTRQVASPQKLCLVVCSGDGPKAALALACAATAATCQERPAQTRSRGSDQRGNGAGGHRNGHGNMGTQEVSSVFLSFFWIVIFRASESPSNSCFRVSANHPDEVRMKDLFLL